MIIRRRMLTYIHKISQIFDKKEGEKSLKARYIYRTSFLYKVCLSVDDFGMELGALMSMSKKIPVHKNRKYQIIYKGC